MLASESRQVPAHHRGRTLKRWLAGGSKTLNPSGKGTTGTYVSGRMHLSEA
jgi:hypothetical protein